jgi:hypothetical protein
MVNVQRERIMRMVHMSRVLSYSGHWPSRVKINTLTMYVYGLSSSTCGAVSDSFNQPITVCNMF